MKFSITGRHVDIGDAFKQSVEQGLLDFMEKYHIAAVDSSVSLSKEGPSFQIGVNIHIGKGVDIRANALSSDAYVAFSNVLDVLATRVRRHKKRIIDRHKHHDVHEKEDMPHYILNGSIFHSQEEDTTGEELSPAIIAESRKDIPKLSVGDAVMRMDLSSESAFVFRNKINDRLNFVYRRSDGNIGWVDPRNS